MSEITIFNNDEFGTVRTIIQDGKPWFVGNDVAKILGYVETAKAIRTHCKGVSELDIPTNGGIQTVKIIPEGDVYRLIFKSKLPNAVKFESWVMDEVLPTIRKSGGYINNTDLMMNTYFSDISDEQKSLVKSLLSNIENLQNKSKILVNENNLLARKSLEWADRPLINALVRRYATSINNDYAKAWKAFKSELLYQYSINLNSRITSYLNSSGKRTKPKTLDMLNDSELPNAIATVISLCKEMNVDYDDLLANKS